MLPSEALTQSDYKIALRVLSVQLAEDNLQKAIWAHRAQRAEEELKMEMINDAPEDGEPAEGGEEEGS